MLFKTTEQVYHDVWKNRSTSPPDNYYNQKTEVVETYDIQEVKLWEEIYFLPGTIGVYVAAQPKKELYLVVHGLFPKNNYGEKVFVGYNAAADVKTFCSNLGIELQLNLIWID